MVKPIKEFPLLEEYKKVFDIDENTVFAFDNNIYCDKPLPPDILEHELVHIKRQNKMGVYAWCDRYINDKEFRLKEEIIAYKKQIDLVNDREIKNLCRIDCAKNLSSGLYGDLIDYNKAFKLLM